MSLHHIYSNASNSTQDITEYVRLYQWSSTTDAKEGSVGRWQMVVDDPDGILDFVGHRRLYSYEDLAAPSNQVVANGFIQNQKVSRGPYRNGAGRIWTLEMADQNVLLHRRVMNGADANRPAENDVNRMEALIGRGGNTPMTELNTVDDSLYFSGVDPVDMDAVDYRTQPVGTGYIDDCAQASGKNHFVWYRESLGEFSLWYDFAASSNWSSLIKLSNVLSDVSAGSNTFAVDLENEAVLDRDPTRVASGVMLPFSGVAVGSNTVSGTVYVQDQDTTDIFAAIDWLAPSLNVKTKAKAEARALRYLADAATQDNLIHASVKLPASNVNDILAGMRVEAKFEHFPGYESFSWMRCLSRTVTEISEDPTRAYRLDLELSPIPEPLCDAQTEAGTYNANMGPVSAGTGNVIYMKSGIPLPVGQGFVPAPGFVGEWNFPDYDVSGQGLYDAAGECVNNDLWCVVQGDGTITIRLAWYNPGNEGHVLATLEHLDSGVIVVDQTQSVTVDHAVNVVFNVSSHGGTFCNHRVKITDTGAGGDCGSKWAFGGFDWVVAV